MPGALALGDRYSLDFLSPLIEQTKQLRKTDEEWEEEELEERERKFWEKNQHRSVKLTDRQGNTTKIALAQFNIDPNNFGDWQNAHNPRSDKTQGGNNK